MIDVSNNQSTTQRMFCLSIESLFPRVFACARVVVGVVSLPGIPCSPFVPSLCLGTLFFIVCVCVCVALSISPSLFLVLHCSVVSCVVCGVPFSPINCPSLSLYIPVWVSSAALPSPPLPLLFPQSTSHIYAAYRHTHAHRVREITTQGAENVLFPFPVNPHPHSASVFSGFASFSESTLANGHR